MVTDADGERKRRKNQKSVKNIHDLLAMKVFRQKKLKKIFRNTIEGAAACFSLTSFDIDYLPSAVVAAIIIKREEK